MDLYWYPEVIKYVQVIMVIEMIMVDVMNAMDILKMGIYVQGLLINIVMTLLQLWGIIKNLHVLLQVNKELLLMLVELVINFAQEVIIMLPLEGAMLLV